MPFHSVIMHVTSIILDAHTVPCFLDFPHYLFFMLSLIHRLFILLLFIFFIWEKNGKEHIYVRRFDI